MAIVMGMPAGESGNRMVNSVLFHNCEGAQSMEKFQVEGIGQMGRKTGCPANRMTCPRCGSRPAWCAGNPR